MNEPTTAVINYRSARWEHPTKPLMKDESVKRVEYMAALVLRV